MQVVVLYMLSISQNRSIWAIFNDRERPNELVDRSNEPYNMAIEDQMNF